MERKLFFRGIKNLEFIFNILEPRTKSKDLYACLHERDPVYFKSPYGRYRLYKLYKKLNRIITEEELYDPTNTEIIIFNPLLSYVFGCQFAHYTELPQLLLCKIRVFHDTDPDYEVIGPCKSVFASWHNPNTYINQCILKKKEKINRLVHLKVSLSSSLCQTLSKVDSSFCDETLFRVSHVKYAIKEYRKEILTPLHVPNNSKIFHVADDSIFNVCKSNYLHLSQLFSVIFYHCISENYKFCDNCGFQNSLFYDPTEECNSSESETDR